MIGSTRQLRVFAFTAPTDMRKAFDALSALVTEQMEADPLSGDLYLFVSRDRRRAKVLHWDGTGLGLYAKRLEQGRFTAPWDMPDGPLLQMTMTELQVLLEGTELVGRWPISPTAAQPTPARALLERGARRAGSSSASARR